MQKLTSIIANHLIVWVIWAGLLLPQVKQMFTQQGLRWTYIVVFSSLLSFLLTPVIRKIAITLSIFDYPSSRKVHKEPTALLGGLSVYIAFTTSLLANNILDTEVIAILIAATVVMLLSLVDDVRSLPATLKLAVQLAATVLVFLYGIRITIFQQHGIGQIANIFLTVIWIVGVTNAMNFLDGIDGLATGLGIVISLFLGIVAFQASQPLLGWFAIAMMGSCFGFLPYNFKRSGPGEIFLGDTGSTFIGFTLACLGIKGDWSQNDPIVSICAPIMIFGILIFDITHTTVSRIFTGKVKSFHDWVSYVGKDHIHHRMYRLFQSNRKTVFFILAISVCLGISAIILRNARTIDGILIVLQGTIAFVLFSLIDYRQEQSRLQLLTQRSWFRIQEHFDVVITLAGSDEQVAGAVLDISAAGARVICPHIACPVRVGTEILLTSNDLDGAYFMEPKGRVVRRRQVVLDGDTEKYMELGIEFLDLERGTILKIIEHLYAKQIKKRQSEMSHRLTPFPDKDVDQLLQGALSQTINPASLKNQMW